VCEISKQLAAAGFFVFGDRVFQTQKKEALRPPQDHIVFGRRGIVDPGWQEFL